MSNDFNLRGTSQSRGNPGVKPVRVADDGSLLAHPRYAELCARGLVFQFSVAAVTMPVNASNLVSVMGIYNPPGSGVMMEMIECEAHAVVATTVVDGLGLYGLDSQTGATFTTQVTTVTSSRFREGNPSAVKAYSSVTFAGTPLLIDLIGGWGAATDGGSTPIRKTWDGRVQIAPNTLISLAMTTTVSTASGITALLRWAEVPYTPQ